MIKAPPVRKKLLMVFIYSVLQCISIQPSHALNVDNHSDSNIIEGHQQFNDEKIVLDPSVWQAQATVTKIVVKGSTVFSDTELAPFIAPVEGETITEESAKKVANKITELYIAQGYLTSKATYEGIVDGVAQIKVTEGGLEEINIEGTNKLARYIRLRVEQVAGPPLNVTKLEEQLLLIKEDPRFESFSATLRPPQENSNNSILNISVKEAKNFTGSIGINNYSNPSIGSTRMNLTLGIPAISELGDSFFVSYSPTLESFTGTYTVDLNYQVPINPSDGTLSARAVIDRSEIVEGVVKDFNITGESELYQFRYRQPLVRHLNEEFALSFGLDYQRGQNFAFQGTIPLPSLGSDSNGETKTTVLVFAQDYLKRDENGAWGLRSQFNIGTYLFNATKNDSPLPDSSFFSWLLQAQRVQVLNPDNTLLISMDLQLSTNALLTSQQFVIGGAQSVRGYRQNVISGDNGARFSVENRIVLARNDLENRPVFTLAPFFDLGAIWNNGSNPTPLIINHTVIAGVGVGLIFEPVKNWNIRLDYAPPLMDINLRGKNVQDNGFYFSTNYRF